MENCSEPISLRNGRLFNSVLTRSGPMQRTTRMRMSQDALLDAFILLYEEYNNESQKKDANMSNFVNKYRTLIWELKSLRVNLDDFELKNVIGQGHFGEVRIVREKQTNDIYAMKIIKKFELSGKICSVLFEEERDIMCTATSPWLTSLQYSFQDEKNLYFIMEYHSGGDLLSLLDRHEGILTPDMARFYLAETALAIRALHQMGYVHRDIKPDNILLDRCGHVKLADFGSAAKLTSGLVRQIMPVGTPEYIAPEILFLDYRSDEKSKKYYGIECDYWSLGILAYELVVGQTPFSGSQTKATYYNIMNHKNKFNYPEDKIIPDSLKDLISKLLEDPSVRLKHDGVVKHPFFRDTNWNNIRNELPPFVPASYTVDDTSNFIDIVRRKSTPRIELKTSRKELSGKHLPFIGFTYSHVPDISEKKLNDSDEGCNDRRSPALEALLSVQRKENKQLVSKLFEAQFGKDEQIETLEKKLEEKKRLLEISDSERSKLQREHAKLQAENANLQRTLELERQDRKEMESNALKLISENKGKMERNFGNQIRQLNARIEEVNDKLTESHTMNNELTSMLDRTKVELLTANKEIERLRSLETELKNKVTETRELKRKSFIDAESRLDKIVSESEAQTKVLQQKLNDETAAKLLLKEKLKEAEKNWQTQESQLRQDNNDYEEQIANLQTKIKSQDALITSLQDELKQKPDISLLEEKLELEKSQCSRLQNKLKAMEQELNSTTQSFLDHESVIAAHEETVHALEKELREASEEKIQLQKKLQKTKEIEEENRQKLGNLEVVVDRLEQGVLKLEAENVQLKQQVIAKAQPITSEAEARYQEKITILEDQIAKLENQLQKLRESAVLEKESLRTTQTALWKAEKELSDAKIDIRIAKREAKTAEDLVNRLQEEIKKLNDKIKEIEKKNEQNLCVEREKLDKLSMEKAHLKTDLGQKDLEIKMLQTQLEELEELKALEKQLKKNQNEATQKCKILEELAETSNDEKDKLKEVCKTLEADKAQLEKTIEDLKRQVCSLEFNNAMLKETGTMLDEQLEDYDKFTNSQAEKIERLTEKNVSLEKEVEKFQFELRSCRQSLNEEKSLKIRAEQRIATLECDIGSKDEFTLKLQNDFADCKTLIESLRAQILEYEEKIACCEMEVADAKQMYDALNGECQWLKKEASSYLTNLYSLRESNYKLTQDLEEEHHLVEALQERICELQNVVTELETFHKQREVKDEATKQQQNKLITFLQEKLDESKKKKTLTDVLFGTRNKENLPLTSPNSCKTPSSHFMENKMSSKNLLNSPSTKEALSQLVKSPKSQTYFQRQASLQRMHHNIPHRFKNQTKVRAGLCIVCDSQISRGSSCSVCTQCRVTAHTKCAIIAPKTCGLPQGLAKHYAKSVAKTNSIQNSPSKTEISSIREIPNGIEGWLKLLNSSKTVWEKRFARLEGSKLSIYEKDVNEVENRLLSTINLSPGNGQVIVGENAEENELSSNIKTNSSNLIKIVTIPETTCWPEQVHYLMLENSGDTQKWLSSLNNAAVNNAVSAAQKYQGTPLYTFSSDPRLNLNCAVPITDKIVLLGADEGLYSLKLTSPNTEPVNIEGVSTIHQLVLAPQIGVVIMIVGEDKRLVTCDHRALVSNAEAASCTNPKINVEPLRDGLEEEKCLLFTLSPSINGNFYNTVATSNKLFLFKWCMKTSQFQKVKVLETLHPCNCMLYTKHSVIVGCDKFFEIGLRDFSVQEFLDPSVKSLAFWKIGSFPMQIFQISKNELLLCFNEFGVFVNENGKKTQCDLKWSKVPVDFAYLKPYLFVIHTCSVEVVRVSCINPKSTDDSICSSSTATVSDSAHINLNNPRFLGASKSLGGILINNNSTSGDSLLSLLEGKKLYKDDLGSCTSLDTFSDNLSRDNKTEGDEFSFTSSLVNSLDNIGSSTPKHSDEDSCSTYTISESENAPSKKVVTFVHRTAV